MAAVSRSCLRLSFRLIVNVNSRTRWSRIAPYHYSIVDSGHSRMRQNYEKNNWNIIFFWYFFATFADICGRGEGGWKPREWRSGTGKAGRWLKFQFIFRVDCLDSSGLALSILTVPRDSTSRRVRWLKRTSFRSAGSEHSAFGAEHRALYTLL